MSIDKEKGGKAVDKYNGKTPTYILTEETLRTYVRLMTVETNYLLAQLALAEPSIAQVLRERIDANYLELEQVKPLAHRYTEMVQRWLH